MKMYFFTSTILWWLRRFNKFPCPSRVGLCQKICLGLIHRLVTQRKLIGQLFFQVSGTSSRCPRHSIVCPVRIGLVTFRMSQRTKVSPICKIGHGHAQQTATSNIIDVMSVIGQPRHRDQCSPDQRNQENQNPGQVCLRSKDMQLACQEQG